MRCERCSGTGFEYVEEQGVEYARPCEACRRGQGKGTEDDVAARLRIPPRYEICNLANFDGANASSTAALEKALKYCAGYPFLGGDEGLGMLFTGSNGVGKTHLAVAVLRELATMKGARGQFWDFNELMREIKSSYDPETKTSELQVLSPVIETDVLLLDDLGAWKITDWMNDTLFHILNTRYLAKRPTLITTNFQDVSPEQAKRADELVRREFFVDRIGSRLRSRLMEMCLLVRMSGEDFRENKQSAHRRAVGVSDEDSPPVIPPRTPPRPRFGG